ncbi:MULTISPECIES: cryptochrome/photolyase family protein [Candidatus Cardinium]|uniref:cryptochrome/photolyase family protein n=1 Tax=Candidatus Cardinium TaxID=273135 RepID=UPI001FA979D6|nr:MULTISPECIES: deoxyribodipyrimidine photo-lyase [Cardinium]
MSKVSIVWLRRNLRLADNKSFAAALRNADKVLPIFIFDTTILKRFQNPYDRRLSFLANTLCLVNEQLQKLAGKLFVFHGTPLEIIPKLVKLLKIQAIYADQDYEPANIERDRKIQNLLANQCTLYLYCDHLLIKPDLILTKYNEPYKVYTPYMQAFRTHIVNQGTIAQNRLLTEYTYQLEGRLLIPPPLDAQSIDLSLGEEAMLQQIGYLYTKDALWDPKNAHHVLNSFIKTKIDHYKANRDFLQINGTSICSPYLRFGLISIRSCYRKALALASNLGAITWVNELIWREFYTYILYHFPNTVDQAFQEKYRGTIPWNSKQEDYDKFIHAQTGYPIVDAAIKQLLLEGWMHNRARMIVASFFTKNLLLDWRKGENFFAQYLMDYELASNVGGWQWSSSCGTDAQPYFRIFNPYLQGKKFDPDAQYVKKYLPSLQTIPADVIHNADFHKLYPHYPNPMVDYGLSRVRAIETFKKAGQ